MSISDMAKTGLAVVIALAAFIILRGVVPVFNFEGGLGAVLTPLMVFAEVFVLAAIALRFGRYLNTRFATGLRSRQFVLILGGFLIVGVVYAIIANAAISMIDLVALGAVGVAILLVWWGSGDAELAW